MRQEIAFDVDHPIEIPIVSKEESEKRVKLAIEFLSKNGITVSRPALNNTSAVRKVDNFDVRTLSKRSELLYFARINNN